MQSVENWLDGGEEDAVLRANRCWKQLLADYGPPPLDDGVDAGLLDVGAKRKESMPDIWA